MDVQPHQKIIIHQLRRSSACLELSIAEFLEGYKNFLIARKYRGAWSATDACLLSKIVLCIARMQHALLEKNQLCFAIFKKEFLCRSEMEEAEDKNIKEKLENTLSAIKEVLIELRQGHIHYLLVQLYELDSYYERRDRFFYQGLENPPSPWISPILKTRHIAKQVL